MNGTRAKIVCTCAIICLTNWTREKSKSGVRGHYGALIACDLQWGEGMFRMTLSGCNSPSFKNSSRRWNETWACMKIRSISNSNKWTCCIFSELIGGSGCMVTEIASKKELGSMTDFIWIGGQTAQSWLLLSCSVLWESSCEVLVFFVAWVNYSYKHTLQGHYNKQ